MCLFQVWKSEFVEIVKRSQKIHIMVVTFIPFETPAKCAAALGNSHLGKQRVECLQIIKALLGESKGYSKHPAALMWAGYVDYLKYYCNCCIDEWIQRGMNNTMEKYDVDENKLEAPWFFANEQFRQSHMASLIRKKPEVYKQKFPSFKQEYLLHGYIWPSHLSDDLVDKMKAGSTMSLDVICDPIGTGAPAHYRVSIEIAFKWAECKTNNPATGRSIKLDGPTYKLYEQAYNYYISNRDKDEN
jgi:hypothetical protein